MLSEQNPEINNSDNRNKPRTKRFCSFYNSKSGCKFGDSCKFRHELLNPESSEREEIVKDSTNHRPGSENEDEVLNQLVRQQPTAESTPVELLVTAEADPEIKPEASETTQPKICHHYSRVGWCRFGKRCRFSHPKGERGRGRITKTKDNTDRQSTDDEQNPLNVEDITFGSGIKPVDNDTLKKTNKSTKQFCRFYLNGYCKFGSSCKYSHNGKVGLPVNVGETKERSNEGKPRAIVNPQQSVRGQQYNNRHVPQGNPSKPTKGRSDLTKEELQALKKTECNQLKKRFPAEKLQIISESEECCYSFEFCPTDPDWPFDIRSFTLKVKIPAQYPFKLFTIELPEDELIPDTVRRYIEVKVAEWLEEKQNDLEELQKVELLFRPFLRWFDRNLESIVTEGLRRYQRELAAKAAGFEFIPSKGPAEIIADDPSLIISTDSNDDESDEDHAERDENDSSYEEDSSDDDDPEGTEQKAQDYSNVERKGTELMLRHLQLKDGAATLVFTKLTIMIQCSRCKSISELSTPGGRLNSIQCVKCNNDQRLIYRPAMAHHFSSVIGYLDLADCQPFDLVLQDSTGTLSCLNCSKNIKLEGFVPGQVKQTWCQRCHQKLAVAAESVRFQQLKPSELNEESQIHQVQVSKVRRLPKDPAIQEGKPLPAEGTCKHYKKSFRWLRFPCCGKCYPCDICHEDKEGDHEMKYAGRMICGFCCKEQPYTAEKPCVSCGSQLTKVHSTHWEGGKGCRDKIKMSRNDGQKYANMGKTISKKAQEKLESKRGGKKTTKLRHT